MEKRNLEIFLAKGNPDGDKVLTIVMLFDVLGLFIDISTAELPPEAQSIYSEIWLLSFSAKLLLGGLLIGTCKSRIYQDAFFPWECKAYSR